MDMFGSSETAEQSIARIVMQSMDKERSKTATIATPAATDKGSTQQEIMAAMVQASLKEQQGQYNNNAPNMMCYRCGLNGHRANECTNPANPSLVEEQQHALGRSVCNECGRWGHSAANCFNRNENAHKRPEGWRGPFYKQGYLKPDQETTGEPGFVALACKQVDEPMTDEMMMAMANTENNGEFLQVSTQHGRGPSLKDPEIFIGDTGATRHSTFCAEGGVNSRAETSADMVQGLTGGPTKAKKHH